MEELSALFEIKILRVMGMETMDSAKTKLDSVQVTGDLESGDGARVTRALEAMNRAWLERNMVSIPMPDPHALGAFGENAPVSVISTYFSVLRQYPTFHPTPSPTEVRHAMVEAIIRYGRGANELVHELALALRTDFQPRAAVEDVMDYLHLVSAENPVVNLTAHRLVDWLLEADVTRPATIEGMRRWASFDDFRDVIEAYRPRLTAAEYTRILED